MDGSGSMQRPLRRLPRRPQDLLGRRVVPCALDNECPSGRVCSSGTCAEVTRCTVDAKCKAGRICDQGTDSCERAAARTRCAPRRVLRVV